MSATIYDFTLMRARRLRPRAAEADPRTRPAPAAFNTAAREAREDMELFDSFPPGIRHLIRHWPRHLIPYYVRLALDVMGAGTDPVAVVRYGERLQAEAYNQPDLPPQPDRLTA